MPTVAYDHQIFALQQFGGISRYFCEVASRMPRLTPWFTRIVAPAHLNSYLGDCDVNKVGVRPPSGFPGGRRLVQAASRIIEPIVMHQTRPDLVHWTYFAPVGSTRRREARSVVTVYDMIHELFPDDFAPGDPTSRAKRHSVEASDHVICISESTKQDLMRLFDVAEQKISVTHLGFSSVFRRDPDSDVRVEASSRPYVLYVGQRGGYKGFADALRAYGQEPRLHEAFDFVAFGGPPFNDSETTLIDSLKLRGGSVRRLVGDDDALARAYRGARVFVYPSRYEGFGIPPLEAMASGCPVVCANTGSLPEVVGDAAECFDPDVPDALIHALRRVCLDDTHRARLVALGYERSRRFSWDRCAIETAAVYTRLLSA